jgi:hypothetical protein
MTVEESAVLLRDNTYLDAIDRNMHAFLLLYFFCGFCIRHVVVYVPCGTTTSSIFILPKCSYTDNADGIDSM